MMRDELVNEALGQLSSESGNETVRIIRSNRSARQVFDGLGDLEADLRGQPELLLSVYKYMVQVLEDRIRERERMIRKGGY